MTKKEVFRKECLFFYDCKLIIQQPLRKKFQQKLLYEV